MKHVAPIVLLILINFWWLGGLSEGYLGHQYGDMADHVWGNEWFAQSLKKGVWPSELFANRWPDGGILWHIDPVGGLFRWFLFFLPSELVWNGWALIHWSLLSVVSYLWSIRKGLDIVQAVFVGAVVMLMPYMSGLIHSGLSEYWGVWLALAISWSISERRFKIAGLFLGLC